MKIRASWVGQSTNLCLEPDKGSPWLSRCFCKFWRFCWRRCCSSCCWSATCIWSLLDGDADCAKNHEEMMMMTMMIGANNGKVQSILWRWHDAVAAMILMKACLSWRRWCWWWKLADEHADENMAVLLVTLMLMKTCLSWWRSESKVLGKACPLVQATQPFSKSKLYLNK